MLTGYSIAVAWLHDAEADGTCWQTRTNTRVTGVAVGIGVGVLEPPPQLMNSTVITKASTGATTRHLFRHMEHPAMARRIRRCQGERRKKARISVRRARDCVMVKDVAGKERRASREGGGSPMPACSLPALRRAPLGCWEEHCNRSAGDEQSRIRTQFIRRRPHQDYSRASAKGFAGRISKGILAPHTEFGAPRPAAARTSNHLREKRQRPEKLRPLPGTPPSSSPTATRDFPRKAASAAESSATWRAGYRVASAVEMKLTALVATALMP